MRDHDDLFEKGRNAKAVPRLRNPKDLSKDDATRIKKFAGLTRSIGSYRSGPRDLQP